MTPNDEQPRPADEQPPDDDVLDLDLEEVLDTEAADASNTSAIEGVEMLDFLDDEEVGGADDTSAAAIEPTIDLSADQLADAESADDGEIMNIEELDAAEAAVEDVDFLEAGETAMFEEGKAEEVFDALDTSEPTVSQVREPTSVSRPDPPIKAPPTADEESGEMTITPPEDDEGEDEFRLREEPDEAPPASPERVDVAAAVEPVSLAAPSRKKKSAGPLVMVILLVLLLFGAAGLGGLYFAGLLPGFDGNVATPDADGQSPADGAVPAPGGDFTKRINEAEEALRDLYTTAKTEDGIDGEKVSQAQALLAKLQTDDADVFAEEPIQQHKKRFDELAVQFEEQEEFNAARRRDEKFREYYTLAEADAPASLDAGMVAEARKYATDAQMKLLDALQQRVADYQAEQARLTAEEMTRKKAEALAAMVAALDDAESYRAAASAYVEAYPDDVLSMSLGAILDEEATTLEVVSAWNGMLDKWETTDMSQLTPAEASELINASQNLLVLASLEGSAEVADRNAEVSHIDTRQRGEPTIIERLLASFASAPAKAALVIATSDGKRYYLAERPAKNGDNFVCKFYADAEGTVQEVDIPTGKVDRDATGKSPVAPLAASIHEMLTKVDENGWEATFLSALDAVQQSPDVDVVVKLSWINQLAVEGSRGSAPLSRATSAARRMIGQAADDGKIELSPHWAASTATAEAQDAYAAALQQLPPWSEVSSKVSEEVDALKTFSVPQRIIPTAMLLGKDGEWTVQFSRSPQEGAALFLRTIYTEEGKPDSRALLGVVKDGAAVMDDRIDAEQLKAGRVVYAVVNSVAEVE